MKEAILDQKNIERKLEYKSIENPNKAEFGDLAAFVDEATIQRHNLRRNLPYENSQQKQY